MFNLVKVAGWSAASLTLNFMPNDANCHNPKEGTFSDCFGKLKTRIFPDIYFSQKVKDSLVFSFYTNSS